MLTGMVAAHILKLAPWHAEIEFLTLTGLSYIMVEVGLEFSREKVSLRGHGFDFFVAVAAAVLPWLFCGIYFIYVLNTPPRNAALVSLFAAPTSAGVLFTLLAAAGLRRTWVYSKAQALAIFDDLATLLLLIPIQFIFNGFTPRSFISVGLILIIFAAAYRGLNRILTSGKAPLLLFYGLIITVICISLKHYWAIDVPALLVAFALGCILQLKPGTPHVGTGTLDTGIKAAFMFLVGLSLPKIGLGAISPGSFLLHLTALTVLANIGKCFPVFCYRREASYRERWALSIALFPRGEVGAGVLLIAMSYGFRGTPEILAGVCLALNLILTAWFIVLVKQLLGFKAERL